MTTNNPFGSPAAAPTGSGPTQATTQPGAVNGVDTTANANTQPAELIDPNDPRLTSENIAMNLSGDAYAQPPVLPDGRWRARLSDEGVKRADGSTVADEPRKSQGKIPQVYLMTTIKATIISPERPEYDGVEVYDSWVSTFLGKDGSSKVSTFLARLKQPNGQPWVQPGESLNQRAWMDRFHRALAGNPEVFIETQWEGSCQDCTELAKKQNERAPRAILGMTSFPPEQDIAKRKAGHNYSPNVNCPRGHGPFRARPRIGGVVAAK